MAGRALLRRSSTPMLQPAYDGSLRRSNGCDVVGDKRGCEMGGEWCVVYNLNAMRPCSSARRRRRSTTPSCSCPGPSLALTEFDGTLIILQNTRARREDGALCTGTVPQWPAIVRTGAAGGEMRRDEEG